MLQGAASVGAIAAMGGLFPKQVAAGGHSAVRAEILKIPGVGAGSPTDADWQKVGDLMGGVDGSGSGVVFYRCGSGKYSLQSEINLPPCPIKTTDREGNVVSSFKKCKNLFYNESYPTLKVKTQKLCQASQSFIPNAITTTTTTVKGGGGGPYSGDKTVVDPVTATGVVTPTGTRTDLETEYGGPITQAALDDMLTKI